MKKLFWFMVGFTLAFSLGIANANDASIGVYGGQILQSHSDCDGDHCLDGRFLYGATVDYDLLDDSNFTLRTGAGWYHLEYSESLRVTKRDDNEDCLSGVCFDSGRSNKVDTRKVSKDFYVVTVKPGITLWDTIGVHGIVGYGNTLLYGAGTSIKVSKDFSLDAEYLGFDDGCDQHSAYVVGMRWSF
jgi:opacity protein-like surface antigen